LVSFAVRWSRALWKNRWRLWLGQKILEMVTSMRSGLESPRHQLMRAMSPGRRLDDDDGGLYVLPVNGAAGTGLLDASSDGVEEEVVMLPVLSKAIARESVFAS
jgi:hypothetical protein